MARSLIVRATCALLLFCALPSCGATSLDLQNSARYQGEIRTVAQGATAVHAHMRDDLRAGKTREQIALDVGWAVFNEAMAFLMQLPPAAPASGPAPAHEEPDLEP